ncbi:MAG: hypothetical protein CBC49_003315 [Alphaproteobacteria bacterium TMED89]|nr:hypothetical protein [Rhodospirillaceae bacterium]RPH17141.1 MAG: hypothetical protein CBC49_003315 [Alphaproteobacteria bacterium TMED89]
MVRNAPMLKRMCAVGAISIGMMAATAVPATADSLQQALVRLYNSSPDLMAARYAVEGSNEFFNEVAANALPKVTSDWRASFTRSYNDILRDTGDFSRTGRVVGGISVEQGISPVLSGGVVQVRKTIEASWVNYDQQEQATILRGIQSYLGVIQAKSTISLQAGNITLLERQLQAAQSRYEAGSGTRTQVAQAQASLASAQADIQQARGNLAISEAGYRQVFGSDPQGLIFPPLPAKMPRTLVEALTVALDDNPSIKAAKVAIEEAEAQKKVTQAELQPSYRVGLGAERTQNVLDGGGTTDFSTSFSLSMPLYGNRQISKSKIRRDEIAIYRLHEALNAEQMAVEQEVIRAWNQYQTAQAVGNARAMQIQAAELSLRGAEAELRAGTSTDVDVVSARQSLTSAQVSASTARVDVVEGAYSLIAAMGLLSARDLALPVRYYVPELEFQNRRIENLATLLYDR